MKWLDKIKGCVRRIFGRGQDDAPEPTRNPFLKKRQDSGPATVKYLRRKMPRSAFTKPMNNHRRKAMLEALLQLRPDQRAVVYRMGWNKGVRVYNNPERL